MIKWFHDFLVRIQGRGQIANPLSRLVERPDAPDFYVYNMMPPKFSAGNDSILEAYKDEYTRMTDSFK